MDHIGTQSIKTKRLVLRRFTVADSQAMFDNWANDPDVTKYLTWPPHDSVEVTKKLLECWVSDYERLDNYQWAIVYEGQLIGSIAVVNLKSRVEAAELGYCIGKNWWHNGIMSEALHRVMKFLFEDVGIQRITACHAPENPHSGNVMKKCGMTYEGTFRKNGWCNQGCVDEVYYGILKSEWKG